MDRSLPALVGFSHHKDRCGSKGKSGGTGGRLCPGLRGAPLHPEGALPAAGGHDIITEEGTVPPHPGQSVYQALTVH